MIMTNENVNNNMNNNNVNNEPKKKGFFGKLGKIAKGICLFAAATGGALVADQVLNEGRGTKWAGDKLSKAKKWMTKTPQVVEQPQQQRRDFNGQRFDRHHGGNFKPVVNNTNNQQ